MPDIYILGARKPSDLMKWVAVRPTVLYTKVLAFHSKGRQAYAIYQPSHWKSKEGRTARMETNVIVAAFILDCSFIMVIMVGLFWGLQHDQAIWPRRPQLKHTTELIWRAALELWRDVGALGQTPSVCFTAFWISFAIALSSSEPCNLRRTSWKVGEPINGLVWRRIMAKRFARSWPSSLATSQSCS